MDEKRKVVGGSLRKPGWIKVERRESPSRAMIIIAPIGAVVISLLIGAFMTKLAGGDPAMALDALLLDPFRSKQGLSEIFVKTTPILLAALGVTIAFIAQFWNIGAEGQFLLGAITSAGLAFLVPGLPAIIMLPLMLIAGFAGGALWGVIPAILKARWGTNEVVTTLMMNHIAILLLEYLVAGPWRDPDLLFPWSAQLVVAAQLPHLPGRRLHLGLVIAIIATVVVFVLLRKTILGYEIRVLGANPIAARWTGINITRRLIIVMILSGGLAGIAGMSEVSGVYYRLKSGASLGYGFTAITVALLGRLNPFGVALAAILIATLSIGGQYMQRSLSIPFSLVDTISALIILFMLGSEILSRYRLRFTLRGT